MDTEHGFRGKLKATVAGFLWIFWDALTLALSLRERVKGEGSSGCRGPVAEAQYAGGVRGAEAAQPWEKACRQHGSSDEFQPVRAAWGRIPIVRSGVGGSVQRESMLSRRYQSPAGGQVVAGGGSA